MILTLLILPQIRFLDSKQVEYVPVDILKEASKFCGDLDLNDIMVQSQTCWLNIKYNTSIPTESI